MQGRTLETAVPGLGSTLPSSATPALPFAGTLLWQLVGRQPLCADPRDKAGPLMVLGKGLAFFPGKTAYFPYPALEKLPQLSAVMPFPWHLCSQGPVSLKLNAPPFPPSPTGLRLGFLLAPSGAEESGPTDREWLNVSSSLLCCPPLQRPGGCGSLLSATAGLDWWASSSPFSAHHDGLAGCYSLSLPIPPARLRRGGRGRAGCVDIPRACRFLN